ncbi:guanine deaminase [Phanerochaete sordida]|uniref:Probable guanine deaminase n=1 Tax=Phanerochaete sordida TaxID=48140 RepID=A0A9P3GA30_9APHY|nr:guanine deaminase [Phanerochaete sordida]
MFTLFYGALITPKSLTEYTAAPQALVCVSKVSGVIEWIELDVPSSAFEDTLAKHGLVDLQDHEVVDLKHGEFLMPGFIDTHLHPCQVPNAGSGQEHELLDWLKHYTFPLEARYKDGSFAKRVYTEVVRRIVNAGTTTCCYFGSLHEEANRILAELVHAAGQRAFVGKCNMDREAPAFYVEPSPDASLHSTLSLISYIRGLTPDPSSALVQPVLTPRFAIACTPDLLSKLSALALSDPSLTIQTHVSENHSEIEYTKVLFKDVLPPPPHGETRGALTYAGVYDAYNLLRENTVLAHAVHLEEEEIELIHRRKAGVSHCPTSNFNLRSGCPKIGVLLDKGIKVGLGTDVSGGFSLSMLTAIQHASVASKLVTLHHGALPGHTPAADGFASKQLSIPTLLYLATQGGADVCNIGARVGSLVPGKAFDALVVRLHSDAGNPGIWGADLDKELCITRGDVKESEAEVRKHELEGLLERFLFCGDERNIKRVYVQGRFIGGTEFQA